MIGRAVSHYERLSFPMFSGPLLKLCGYHLNHFEIPWELQLEN